MHIFAVALRLESVDWNNFNNQPVRTVQRRSPLGERGLKLYGSYLCGNIDNVALRLESVD